MKTLIKSSILLLLFVLLKSEIKSQSYTTALTVRMDGYIINLGGEIIFQPTIDTVGGIFKSLDNSAFGIWCNQINDQYCEAIENIGDSLPVRLLIDSNTKYYDVNMKFFYCTIEVDMHFLSTNENDFKVYKRPRYEILFEGKKYPIIGFYIREWVRKLIPREQKDLYLMYKYYTDKGHRAPKFLEEAVSYKKSY